MNRFLSAAALALAIVAAPAASADTLTIDITNIKTAKGKVYAALFDANGFAANKSLQGVAAEVAGDTVRISFEGVAPGTYGVKLYHDVNGNGKLDRNLIGMPSEPYGFSNDAPVRMGPPRWADAAFEYSAGGAVQTITLN
ncbi:DUF2141 domain-containing protein [Hyphomonas sp.]|uniref:DUF2141 domain-containing protein n=1 Tax=Hyphomonas sp. TaxID=87 RepID=UPI00391A8773